MTYTYNRKRIAYEVFPLARIPKPGSIAKKRLHDAKPS
jgi:hypothetical protein